jgi:hypothetical protein
VTVPIVHSAQDPADAHRFAIGVNMPFQEVDALLDGGARGFATPAQEADRAIDMG